MSLENELLRQDQRTANAFTGSSYDDVLAYYEDRGLDTNPFQDTHTTAIDTALEGLSQNEAGQYFNASGERVYVYRDSAELGDDSGGYTGRNLVMRTEAEIRDAWEADEGMGYFKEANPQLSFDDYMGFISEKDDMYASGVFDINPGDDLYNIGHKGRGPNADAINAILEEQKAGVRAAEDEANASLNDKYGIQTTFQNDDGDTFKFNGATYTKTDKIDDHLGVGDYVKMGAGVLMSVYAAPLLAGSLGAVMGPAAAKAAAAAIVSQANAFVNGQGLSIGDALQSAAMAYGGAKLGDLFASGGELSGTVSEITDKVTSATDKFNELITTGNSIADAAIKAGGMSMLTSLVTTGEVDIESAGLAALMAGGAEGLGKLNSSLFNQGVEGIELEEVVVTAQRKGTQVADGLTALDNGIVINSSGEIMGNMSDLDLDGDGLLNGNDLQNITTPNRDLAPESYSPNQDKYNVGDDVYIDANGNAVDPSGITYSLNKDGYVDRNGNLVTSTTYGEAFGSNDSNVGPVDNSGGLKWVDYGDNTGAVTFEDGTVYAEKVNGQWVNSNGDIIDDPRLVDELTMVAAKAIDAPLESVQYFDQSGNAINYKYVPHTLRDNLEQGQFSGIIFGPNGETQEVWYDPTTGTEYIKSEAGFQQVNQVELPDDTTETTDSSDSSASGDPNDSTTSATGEGGGETTSEGGAGDAGATGGSGTLGGGADAGGSSNTGGNSGITPSNGTGDTVTPGGSDSDGSQGSDTGGGTAGGGTDGTAGGSDSGDGTGGTDDGGDSTGTGTGDGTSTGDGTGSTTDGTGGGTSGGGDGGGDGTGDGGGSGSGGGEGGGSGGGSGGATGGGTSETPGPLFGVAPGTVAGWGEGGGGSGLGEGMMGGGGGGGDGHNPSWGELFSYTTIDGYKAKQLAPYKDAIIKAKGMLS